MPAVTSLLIVGAGITISAIAGSKQRRRRAAILRAVAERRRGNYNPGGFFGNPTIELTLAEGVQIDVSMWATRHDQGTEYRAYVPPPGLPSCKVAPTGFTGWVGRALGVQDIDVGEPLFDRTFVVKGDDPGLVRRMWTRSSAQLMVGIAPTGRLECGGNDLKLLQPVIDSVEQVEAGIDLVLELVRNDPYGVDALGELPEARVRASTSLPHAELPGPSKIQVGPREQSGVVRTCVWTAAIGAPDAALPDDTETIVTALEATLERTPAEVQLWWRGIETDPRRLIAAVELLRRLASGPSLGVFR